MLRALARREARPPAGHRPPVADVPSRHVPRRPDATSRPSACSGWTRRSSTSRTWASSGSRTPTSPSSRPPSGGTRSEILSADPDRPRGPPHHHHAGRHAHLRGPRATG
ncbi:MAG: hypothetical protein M0C28_35620 [Candidatus Moduliflexus flocculans]|nr:hypothetical protein [Candidatus Moduliflexus flocculans]